MLKTHTGTQQHKWEGAGDINGKESVGDKTGVGGKGLLAWTDVEANREVRMADNDSW